MRVRGRCWRLRGSEMVEFLKPYSLHTALNAYDRARYLQKAMQGEDRPSREERQKTLDDFLEDSDFLINQYPKSRIKRAIEFAQSNRILLTDRYDKEFSKSFDQIWKVNNFVSDVGSIFSEVYVPIISGEPFIEDIKKVRDERLVPDLIEASNCLRIGLGTASIFHQSRCLELMTRLIGKRIRLSGIGPKTTWQEISGRIDGHIKSMPDKSKVQREKRRKFGALSAALNAARLSWRNEVMHPGDMYSTDEARDFFRFTLQVTAAYDAIFHRS